MEVLAAIAKGAPPEAMAEAKKVKTAGCCELVSMHRRWKTSWPRTYVLAGGIRRVMELCEEQG